MIITGMLFAIPIVIAIVLYAKWLGKRIYQIPSEDGLDWIRPEEEITIEDWIEEKESKDFPSLLRSAAPIVVPVFLIFLNTTTAAMELSGMWVEYVQFFGSPIIAVGIGVLLAIYGLFGHVQRSEALDRMEEGIKQAGIVLLVTGAGGALGFVLRTTGVGDHIADIVVNTGIPAILLPFVVATLVRFIQGSGTVAMITAASITAPILSGYGCEHDFCAQAAALGSLFFYFNDSLFWVVNRTIGIKQANTYESGHYINMAQGGTGPQRRVGPQGTALQVGRNQPAGSFCFVRRGCGPGTSAVERYLPDVHRWARSHTRDYGVALPGGQPKAGTIGAREDMLDSGGPYVL